MTSTAASSSTPASNWPWSPVLVWIDPLDSRERARARRALARKKLHQERLLAASQSRKSTPTPPHSRTSSPAPTPTPASRRNVVAVAAASPTTSTLTLASSMLQLAADAADLSDVDMDDYNDADDLSDVESSIPPPAPAPRTNSHLSSPPPATHPAAATPSTHSLSLSLSSDDDDASDLDDAVTAALDSGDIELAKLFSPSEHPAIRRRLRDTQRLGGSSTTKSIAQAAHELVDAVGLSLEDEQLWWPAAVIPMSDIPGDGEITPQRKLKGNELYVRYFEDNTFSIVLEADVQIFTGHDPLYHWFHERNPSELANNRGIRRALRFLNEGKVAHGFMWRKWRQRCRARSFPLVEDMSDTEELKAKARRDKEREEARKVMSGEVDVEPEGLSDLDDSDQEDDDSPPAPTHHHHPPRAAASSSSVPTAPPSPSPFCDGEDPLQLDLELQMELDAIAAMVDEDDASFVPSASTGSAATPRRAKGGSTGRPRGRPRGSGGGARVASSATTTSRKRPAPAESATSGGGKRGPGRPPTKKKRVPEQQQQEQYSIPTSSLSSSSSTVPTSSSSTLDRLSTSSPTAIHSDDSLATPPLSAASHSTSAHSTPPRLNSPDSAPAIVLPGPDDDLASFQVSTVHAPAMCSSSLSLLDSSSPPPPDMHDADAPALAASGIDGASDDSRSTNASAKGAAKGVSSRELAQLNKFFYCKDSTNLPPTRRRRTAARDGLISPTSAQFEPGVMSLSSSSLSSLSSGHVVGHGGARRASTSTVTHAHQHQSRACTISGSSASFGAVQARSTNKDDTTAHTPFSSLFHASLNFDLDDDADLSSVPPSPDVLANPSTKALSSSRRVNGITTVKHEPGSKPRPAPLNLAGISAAAGAGQGQRTAPLMGTGFRDVYHDPPPASAGIVGLGLRRASSVTGAGGAAVPAHQQLGHTPARTRKTSVTKRAGASPKAGTRTIANGSGGGGSGCGRQAHVRSRQKSPDARPHTPLRRVSTTPPALDTRACSPSPSKHIAAAAAAAATVAISVATPLANRPSAAAKRYRTSLLARMHAHFSAHSDHLADIDTSAPNVLPALVDVAPDAEALDAVVAKPVLRTCTERTRDRLACAAVSSQVASGDELAWEAGLAELRRLQAEAVAVRKVAEALGGWDPNATVPNSPEGAGAFHVEIGGSDQAGSTKRSAAQAELVVEGITVANRPKRARKLIDYSVFCVAGSPSPVPSPVPPTPAPIAVAAGVEHGTGQQHPLAQVHMAQQQQQQQRRPNAVLHPAAAGLVSPPPPQPMQPGSGPSSAMTSPTMIPMLPPSALFSTGIGGATMAPLPPPAVVSQHVAGMRSPPLASMYIPATAAHPQSPVRMGYQPPLPHPPTSSLAMVLPHYSPVFAPMHHPPNSMYNNHVLAVPPMSSGMLPPPPPPSGSSSAHFPPPTTSSSSSAPMSTLIPLPALPPPPPTPPATFLPPILTHAPMHHHHSHHHSAPSSSMPSPLMHHAALAAGGGGGHSTSSSTAASCASLLVVSPVSPPAPSSSATAPPPPGVYAPAHVAAMSAHGMVHAAAAHAATVTPQ